MAAGGKGAFWKQKPPIDLVEQAAGTIEWGKGQTAGTKRIPRRREIAAVRMD